MQPWHFIAVSQPELNARVRVAAEREKKEFYVHRASHERLEALAPLGTDEHKSFIKTAPWLIAVFLKNSRSIVRGIAARTTTPPNQGG